MAYDKKELATRLLDGLLSGSMAEAARRCGISPSLPFKWLVQSKLGHPDFQEVLLCDVVAPFHVHYEKNIPALMAMQVQQTAFERARDGCLVDVFFQGVRHFETVPTKQWLKPSDALVAKMLESWNRRRYGAHQQIDVNYGGVLRLERPDEPAPSKAIDADFTVFEDTADAEQPGRLALARPANDAAELDKWAAAGEFAPATVTFVDAKGERTELRANLEAHLQALKQEGPEHRQPSHHVAIGKPDPTEESEPPALPPQTIADHPRAYTIDKLTPYKKPVTEGSRIVSRDPAGIERTGRGPDPATFGGVQGFKKI